MDQVTREKIKGTIDSNRVVLFMKGSKLFPQCGFSARVVEILKRAGTEFQDVNVLADPELREGIKEFSNWPTVPQLYIDGKFVGGCDIVSDLDQSGELQGLLGAAK
jgi:monothiol glutaredoxin